MSQILRPSSDVGHDGAWEAIPDDGTFWDKIDEESANDADYAWHNAVNVADYFEVHLSDPGDTPAAGAHTVRWRMERIAGSNGTQVLCELRAAAVVKGSQEVAATDAWQNLSFEFNPTAATAWQSPGTRANIDRDGKTAWVNVDGAASQNDNWASVTPVIVTHSDWLRCTNFGFDTGDIPDGSTILGIEVEIDKFAPDGFAKDSAIYLRKTAGQMGDNKADATLWETSDTDTYFTYGSSSDTWNSGLSDDDIRDSGFGVDISALNTSIGSYTAFIDHVRIKVHFFPPVDYTDLRLRFSIPSVTKKGDDIAVSWCEMEVPDGGGVPPGWNRIEYTSEPPTPNAWNQIKREAGTGWKKLEYE